MGDEALQIRNGAVARADTGVLVDPTYLANTYVGDGPPTSGTTGDTAGYRQIVRKYQDQNTGAEWVNESSNPLSPYWTPVAITPQGAVWGVADDFRGEPGTAITDTGAENIYASGVRVFGQGIAETDSGAVSNTAGEGGVTLRMTTNAADAKTLAIGGEAGIMQPDQHKLLAVEAEITQVSALTLRAVGIGFVGAAADAFDPPMTFSGTTCTLVLDDLALMHFSVEYTDTDRWYVGHNKANAAASMTAVDTSTDVSAVGTYQRLRVEVDVSGNLRCFINKAQVAYAAAALDVDEEVAPVLYIESTSAAVKIMDVRRYAHWAMRP